MLNSPLVIRLIDLALEEDLKNGDITTLLTVADDQTGTGEIFAKEPLVLCGSPLISIICERYDVRLQIELFKKDGDFVEAGEMIARLSGLATPILNLERVILNFLQRLSGIATKAREFSDAAGKTLKVQDTRKTVPGWRVLEKYAVWCGGGTNHRMSLSDLILVKDNHIVASGGDIRTTLERVYSSKPDEISVEVEVDTLEQLKVALEFKPEIVMLDNFDNHRVKEGLEIIQKLSPDTRAEISGGITIERIPELVELGASYVSTSAMTARARHLDISMDFKIDES